MTLTPIDVLVVVAATFFAAGGCVHRLAVDASRGPWRIRLLLSADLGAKCVVNDIQGAVVPPLVEVTPDGAPGREVLGQITPLAARAKHIQDGVEYVAYIRLAWPATGVDRDERLDQGPLFVRYVAGVRIRLHHQML